MSKQLTPSFPAQWLLVQTFGSIAIALATQALVTLVILLAEIDNLGTMYSLRLIAYLTSSTSQGYLQWHMLKQVVNSLDRAWIYTSIIGIPIHIITWCFLYLCMDKLVLDEDGTVLIIFAVIGAVGGGFSGRMIGNWQKSLLKERLYWRSLWHDWDRDHALAGALGGIISAIIIVTAVVLFGWHWISDPIGGFIASIALASTAQFMYGFIIGETIYDVFKQARLLE